MSRMARRDGGLGVRGQKDGSLTLTGSLPPAHGLWRLAWRRLLRNRLAVTGLGVIAVFGLVALLAPLIAPHDPSAQNLRETFEPLSLNHLAGTDNLGRDWFSRLLYGARLSIAVGLFAQLIVLGIGVPVGLAAGHFGKGIDTFLMRTTDLVYAFPDLLLIILLRSVLGGSIFTLFLIIGIVSWVDIARLVRGQVLGLKGQEFIEAARSLGASDRDIMARHLFPNLLGPLIVVVAFGVPRAIFIEASLSFIGVGANPGVPSWGSMVQEAYAAIFSSPHLVIFPSAAIALLMLAFTFAGDGLRDALDPRTEVTARPRRDIEEPTSPALPVPHETDTELPRAA
ncbi:MAG: ABC transporter permease subunit [Dehalococcoidia bacterium]|nr:ABC transporter permease subunit [Dehalococcoidia bacterium]